jgi:hypothetical protein
VPTDATADSQYSARGRGERLIVAGRVVLAAYSLIAIWLEPFATSKHAGMAYTLLVAYLAYALRWRLSYGGRTGRWAGSG